MKKLKVTQENIHELALKVYHHAYGADELPGVIQNHDEVAGYILICELHLADSMSVKDSKKVMDYIRSWDTTKEVVADGSKYLIL